MKDRVTPETGPEPTTIKELKALNDANLKKLLLWALDRTGGAVLKAAKLVEMPHSSFSYYAQKLKIGNFQSK